MKKKTFYTELAYIVGLLLLALGTALMERAGYGLSMVVAPAYLIYLKVSQFVPFFTFGMAEYCFQAVLLVVMTCILRKFRPSFLFSIVTAVIYGFVLDGAMALTALIRCEAVAVRLSCYLLGFLFCALGISFLFHAYLPPAVYELLVKRIATKWGVDINRVKTVYDCTSCAVAITLSFAFFGLGQFEGVRLGTILCAPVNGTLIGLCSRCLEHFFVFRDRWRFRSFFE